MTQIPYRMPSDLIAFIVANSVATNQAQEILAGLEGRSPEGAITEKTLKTIVTLNDLCDFLRESATVIEAMILLHVKQSPLSTDFRRKILIEQSAIAKRLIDEMTVLYTAHERN